MSFPIVQIQARLGSTRLPGKVMYELGGKRVIEWVVHRCRAATRPESVVLTIGDAPENTAVAEWCERKGVPYQQGPEANLLTRHRDTAHEFNSDPVIRVTGDCPFTLPSEIDRLINHHSNNTSVYTTNVVEDLPPGLAVDIINRDVLDELTSDGATHPVKRLRESPEQWDIAIEEPPEELVSYTNNHTAVDTPIDYWALHDAIEVVGTNPRAVLEWLTKENI